MKILLANAYFYRFDRKQWKTKQPYPPLGTLYAASVLKSQGHTIRFIDNCLEPSIDRTLEALRSDPPDLFIIYEDGFNYLTKMCLVSMREAALDMVKEAVKGKITVICSSSDATDRYETYLQAGVNFVVLGEGEVTLGKLVDQLSRGEPTKDLLGIAYRQQNEIVKNSKRPVVRDLDSLPDPAWDLVNFDAYRNIWEGGAGYFSLNIATTRGCPFKCNWCAKPIYGNRYNTRSPERVVAEISWLMEHTGASHFWVCDDIFGLKPGWVQRFSRLVEEKNLRFTFKIQSRVDLLLESDTIDALVRAGVRTVWVGAESGSQSILDAMEKGTSVDQIYRATRLLQQQGVAVGFFLQFGYLGETKEDIDRTIDMLLDLMPQDIGVSVSYPLPGTSFYEKVVDQMREKQNWIDSDDLAMMYQGTYSRAYYRRLHRYVHRLFRKRQILLKLREVSRWFDRPSIVLLGYYWISSILDRIKLQRLESKAS